MRRRASPAAITWPMRSPRTWDGVLTIGSGAAAAVLFVGCGAIVGDVARRGGSTVTWKFLSELPLEAGRSGGIRPVLEATGLVLFVCMGVVLPVGLLAAIGLAERSQRGGRLMAIARVGLDVLAGAPSIVFGLFGHALFCGTLGMRASVLTGGLTLACMTLPLFVRLSELALRAIPSETRAAIEVVGLTRFTAVFRVLLPAAASGLVSAAALALARGLAETAALLFTSGYVLREPRSLTDPGRVIAVHIYDLSMNVAGGDPQAYASACVLLAVLLAIGVVPIAVRGLAYARGSAEQ